MSKLEVLLLLQELLKDCDYSVPGTGGEYRDPDYVVDYEDLCDNIEWAIKEETSNG